MMSQANEAPCVAVVGPANAGKSTLLYQLDQRLKRRLDGFMVIKGQPDGTGMYQYRAPEYRNDLEFKKAVKGQWGEATIEHICEWIRCGRQNLSLAMLDFGGRHDAQTAAGNAQILSRCSHYLLVSKSSDDAGGQSWDLVCREYGLSRVGWMHSLPVDGGDAPVLTRADGDVEATFRLHVTPDDPVNDAVLAPLVDSLVRLSRPPDQIPYVNLWQAERWTAEQVRDAGGHAARIAQVASRTGVIVLGGAAPVWAYLAGLSIALAANPRARAFFFDPKQPECLVEIPPLPVAPEAAGRFPSDLFRITWKEDSGRSVLQFEILAGDKFLPPSAAENLAGAPAPPRMPSPHIGLSGKAPMWVYGAYARWLIAGGAQTLASWDMGTKAYIPIWSRGDQARSAGDSLLLHG
jgi:hypothetical protein